MKKLIINADDFGMCEGVTKGIIDSHVDGVLTSTTLMVNMPYAAKALEMAKDYPLLGVGIHLVLTCGSPMILGAKSFTKSDGTFKKQKEYKGDMSSVDLNELYLEWKTQIEHFIRLSGKKPTHIDSHHHVHLNPSLFDTALKLAKEYDLPMRLDKKMDYGFENLVFLPAFYADKATMEYIDDNLKDDGIYELMCHPAYLDKFLHTTSSYSIDRIYEMDIIRSNELRNYITENNIVLINYSNIKKTV